MAEARVVWADASNHDVGSGIDAGWASSADHAGVGGGGDGAGSFLVCGYGGDSTVRLRISHSLGEYLLRSRFHGVLLCLVTNGTYPTSNPGGGVTSCAGSSVTRAPPVGGAMNSGVFAHAVWICSTRVCSC